jgi:hypothetical protein
MIEERLNNQIHEGEGEDLLLASPSPSIFVKMPVVATTTTNYTFDDNNDDQSNRKNTTNDILAVKNDQCN